MSAKNNWATLKCSSFALPIVLFHREAAYCNLSVRAGWVTAKASALASFLYMGTLLHAVDPAAASLSTQKHHEPPAQGQLDMSYKTILVDLGRSWQWIWIPSSGRLMKATKSKDPGNPSWGDPC